METEVRLTDKRLLLRPVLPDDAQAFYNAVRESIPEISPWMDWCTPGYSLEIAQAWTHSRPQAWSNKTAFASAAAPMIARFGFGRLGLIRVEIVAAVENLASQRVAEKAGAVRERVLRNRIIVRDRIYDSVMFSLVPEDLNAKSEKKLTCAF